MPAVSQELKKLIFLSALVALTGITIFLILVASEETGPAQIILIALILLLWPIGVLVNYYRRRRQGGEQTDAEVDAAAAPKKPRATRASRSYEELERGAYEATQWLDENLDGTGQSVAPVYRLPWFMIAGQPKTGKTSLLLSAGMTFNALPSQRRADQNLLRPTGSCDWRVTDQAVWIDTAGRYQTEEVRPEWARADGAQSALEAEMAGGFQEDNQDEWLGLIGTLKKYRKKRPLDGLVLTASAWRLIGLNESEIEQEAQLLRDRLDQLIAGTGARFPVYLVFTQADRIPGFMPFFKHYNQTQRAQVWGATIPLAQAEAGPALFDTEFDYLLASLMRRRMLRLSAADKPAEQLQVFDFPLHFNQTRRKLGLFTMALFRQSLVSGKPLFRGFYFASCPAPRNNQAAAADQDESRIINPGYFAEDFFREVLLRDKDLAASFQETKAQPNRHRKLMLAAAALAGLCLFLTAGMIVSFFNNRSLIEIAKTRGDELLGQFKPAEAGAGYRSNPSNPSGVLTPPRAGDSAGSGPAVTQSDLNSLNSLLDVINKIDGQIESRIGSLPYRFGLYSGEDLRPRLREIYFEFVSQRFLTPALSGLSQRLDQTSPAQNNSGAQGIDQEQLYYDMLKAYKMGERQAYVEPVFWREQLAEYWREPATLGEKRHLVYFTDQAGLSDEDDGGVPRPQTDDERVKSARRKLQNYAVEKLVYSQIIRGIEKQGQPYYLRDITKGQFGSELIDNAGSQSTPYAFTKQAYYKYAQGTAWLKVYEELKEKNENDYVLDRKSEYERVEPESLRQRYQADYVTAWQKFLDDLRVKNFDRKKDAVEALEALSQENSAFAAILKAVEDQTTLSKPPVSAGFTGWLKSWTMKRVKADTRVEVDFSPLRTFNISGYLGKLKEVQNKLRAAYGDEWRQAPNLKDDANFQAAMAQARDSLLPLKSSNATRPIADLLERPLKNIDVGLGKGLSADLNQAWSKVLSTARQLEARYPFTDSSIHVQSAELRQYLNPVNGELSQFYERVRKDLDGGPGRLTPRNRDQFNPQFIDYLNGMLSLRDTLFPANSEQPRLDFTVSLKPPPGVTAEIILGDTRVRSDGGALQTQNAFWPPSVTLGVTINRIQDGLPQQLQQYPDTWGLFRMLANARLSDGRYSLEWSGVRAIIQPGNKDPFRIRFTQLRAPQSYQSYQ
ncbi:MAG TPA: type VI secretion protein IcmF/TssM N-terminal domain-containing protein [Blastocatellia bacterium]|nr:type VI secretion protein IcmF/TssM N-terminal domain-containing protein [Blastocatellia bacterium]